MGIEVVTTFIAKATVWVRAYLYDSGGTLTDPDTSIKVTITDPDGTAKVDDQAMTKDSTGIYDYYYNTTTSSVKGHWRGEVVAIDGIGEQTVTSPGRFAFEVEA